MTTEELSNEFDTLVNSYSTQFNYGNIENTISFDEYEKSIFLTKAQEELLIEFYNGKNPFRDVFEKSEEVRRYLSELVKTYKTNEKITDGYIGLSPNSVFFKLPEDAWFITYEAITIDDSKSGCKDGETIVIVPTTQDEYYKTSKNPFKRPNERKALRLDIENNIVEIISKYNVSNYLVRYITKPKPIILIDLPEGISIDNLTIKTECRLNPALHRQILDRAIRYALISKGYGVGN